MPAEGVINKFRALHGDVSWKRTDGSPVADLDSPIYYSSASRIFMGPVSGGGGGSGSFSLGVSTGGNTLGQTGVTGTRVVLAGEGAITLSQLTDGDGASITLSAPVQSVQTQSRFNLTLGGNTAGAPAEVSSGTLTLAGGPNVTLSQVGNAITISGPDPGAAQSNQTLGLYADGNTTGQSSSTTRDARSVTLHGDGAVSVGFSGGSIRISAPTQSVQPETQTFIGGVAASDVTYTSGTVQLAALGNVTVRSTTGQQIQISVPAQSVQPETQTFVGGIAGSNTTYTSGTVRISGVGGGVTVSSNTGQRIDISVAAPAAQTGTQFSAGVSGGNTAGDTGTVAGRLVLVGGNRVTLSGSTNGASMTVTVSAPNAQTGISSIAASNATYTSGQVEFTGSGIITIRSSAGQRVVVDASQSAQTQDRFNVTLSGNTAGGLQQVSSGTLTLAGGNNITLSQAGNAITISGANAAGAQTGISGLANSQTTYTSGTVSLSELGAITIRSTTGNQFQFSVNPQSVQPETQTFVGGIAASDTTYTSGTIRFTGVGGGITVSSNTGQRVDLSVAAQSAESQSIGMSNIGNTSGTTGIASGAQVRMLFAGGNNVTLSQSLNGASGTITISAASQSVQSVGLYALGNTTGQSSSTTRDARSVSVEGAGVVSVGYSGGSLRISAPAQTGTQFSGGISGGNTAGDTGTVAGRMVLAGGNNITLSGSTNGASETISIVGPNTLPSFSGGISGGNTVGDTGATGTRLVFAGGNNITLSGATNANGGTITISGANVGGAQTGISGIIASDATYTSGTVEFTGSNMITVKSSAGQRVVIDATQSVQSLGMYALGNTTGQSSSTTRDGRSVSVVGDGAVSVGFSGGSLRISAPTQSVQPETQTFIGGISASDALYTSGTVRITGVGGGITVSTNTGQRIDLSVAAPVAQTNQTLGLYALGNTTGQSSSTTRDARSLSVEGAGIISVGYSGGSLRISATQSVQPETQTFVGGLANSQTTYTSGTVGLSELGAITIRSTTGNQFQLSVNPQTGTQFSGGISGGNTAGDTGTVAGRLVLAGGANITLSGSTNGASETVSIVGPAAAAFSAGVSNVGNTGGDTGVTGTRLVLAGLGAATLSQATAAAGGTVSISVPAQTAESQSIGMSNLGNTSGTTGVASGAQVRFVLVGGNSITLSQSLNGASGTITISGATTSQSVQSLGMYAVQNTTGQSSSTTMDARTISVAGDGAASVGYSGGSLRISVPTQTVQTQGVLSAGVSNVGNTAGNTQVSTGSRLVLAGAGNISLSQATAAGASTISISGSQSVQSLGMYAVQNTTGQSSSTTMDARTLSVAGDGAVSVGYSAGSLRISAPVQTGTQFSAGISGGNTAGDTGTVAGRLVLAGGANITLSGSTNGVSETVSIVGGAGGGGNFSAGASNLGNTAGATGISGTQMVLVGSGVMSLSQTTGANGNTVSILGPASSVISAVAPLSTTTNGSTISILGPAQLSVGFSTHGNTAGSTGLMTGRVLLVGSNNITLSGSTNAGSQTISIIGGAGGGFSAGASNLGNTAGDTGVTGTRLVLVGTNNITLSQATGAAGATISISGGAGGGGGGYSAGVSTGGNTAGATGITGSQLVLVGASPISLSQTTGANGGTVSINAPATSSLVGTNGISISTNGSTISISGQAATLSYFNPQDAYLQVAGQQGQGTLHIQPLQAPNVQFDRIVIPLIYSGATNSTGSQTLSVWGGYYSRTGSTISLISSFSTSVGVTHSGTQNSSQNVGLKLLTIGHTDTILEGQYWMGIVSRTTSGGANGTISQVLASQMNSNLAGHWGVAPNATDQYTRGLGRYSATTSGMPASIAFSHITGTASLQLRQPIYYLASGTV